MDNNIYNNIPNSILYIEMDTRFNRIIIFTKEAIEESKMTKEEKRRKYNTEYQRKRRTKLKNTRGDSNE